MRWKKERIQELREQAYLTAETAGGFGVKLSVKELLFQEIYFQKGYTYKWLIEYYWDKTVPTMF